MVAGGVTMLAGLRVQQLAGFAAMLVLASLPHAGAAAAADTPAQQAAPPITAISLERTWCYGSCPIDELVLRADGTAAYTGRSNTRQTGNFTGTFWDADFARLAQALVADGFDALRDSYGHRNVDAAFRIVTADRGSQRKSVINHDMEGSDVLWGMERLILGTAADIAWQPVATGIRGVVTWQPQGTGQWLPVSGQLVLIQSPGDTRVFEEFVVRADAEGRFEIPLDAGTYELELSPRSSPQSGLRKTVEVRADAFTQVAIRRGAGGTFDMTTSE